MASAPTLKNSTYQNIMMINVNLVAIGAPLCATTSSKCGPATRGTMPHLNKQKNYVDDGVPMTMKAMGLEL